MKALSPLMERAPSGLIQTLAPVCKTCFISAIMSSAGAPFFLMMRPAQFMTKVRRILFLKRCSPATKYIWRLSGTPTKR